MNQWIYKNWKTLHLYHRYYKRSGLYRFILKNAIKVFSILVGIIFLFYFLEKNIMDIDHLFKGILGRLEWPYVLSVFLISETFLGLIPPDFFIVWSRQFEHHLLMLTYLAVLSYVGGIFAYQIGTLLHFIPRIRQYIDKIFNNHFIKIKKWGGIIIVAAAMFPLPFASISMIAGVMKFPFNFYLLFGIARILRFYVYAFVIFQLMR